MVAKYIAGSLSAFCVTLALACPVKSQSAPIFVQLPRNVTSALYLPESGGLPTAGIVVMHREANYMNNIACREFARRGFAVLCMNSRFVNNESSVKWELIPLDVGEGVKFLRDVQKVSKIILYGSSGGGVTMSFYQAVAENGPKVCQGARKLVKCSDNLAGLPKADGIILVDGHPGNPILRLRSINPAISGDLDNPTVNADLDPFDPKNGYVADGPSRYSEEFKAKYFRAQASRMNKLIELAQSKMLDLKAAKSFYTDDEPFNVPGLDGARLQSLDLSIRHTTVLPQKLLRNDGSISVQVVESIAPARPNLAKAAKTFKEGARGGLTLQSFLSSNAIRAGDSLDESKIDLCSSNNSTPCMLQSVSVPLLAAAMQGSYQNLIQEIEINYNYAKTSDKDFIVVEGATTQVTPCKFCSGNVEKYSNATKVFFDYAAAWIRRREESPNVGFPSAGFSGSKPAITSGSK